MKSKQILTLLVSLVITAIFLVLALYRVDFHLFAQAFVSADYILIGLAGLIWLSAYVFRTKRWQVFLSPTKQIPVTRLFSPLMIGFALNNLLPGRPGEFARAFLIGSREGISKTLSLATIVVERVMDGIAVIFFLLLSILSILALNLNLPAGVQTIAMGSIALFGVALAGLIFVLVREDIAFTLLKLFTRFLPARIAEQIEKMFTASTLGLHSLKSARDVLTIVLCTFAVWALDSLVYFLILTAFGALPDVSMRIAAAVTMTSIINLGIMIPAAPGGLGPYEAAGVFALATFGVNESLAASVSLGAHAVEYVIITGLGLYFIWRQGVSLAQASKGDE